ncbi:MAG: hypothetical protein ABIP71_11485 [Verrucomicrobiota bacterium]
MSKKKQKIVIAVLLALVLVAFFMRDSRLVAQWRFAGDAHVPKLNSNFADLPKVVSSKNQKIGKIVRGLPHNFNDEDEFVRDLWNSENVSIHGYRFYKEPLQSTPEFESILHSVMTSQKSFRPYGGPKMCGGYHADFAAQFEDSWFLVCLGCHEILCYSKKAQLICEFDKTAYQSLSTAWSELNKGRNE